MSFLRRSSDIQEELGVEPLLLHIERRLGGEITSLAWLGSDWGSPGGADGSGRGEGCLGIPPEAAAPATRIRISGRKQNGDQRNQRRKTEVMVFGPKPLRDRLDHMITIDGISLTSSLSVRNLGVTFDQNLSFNSHIKIVSRSAFFHLRNITRIRKLPTRHDAEKLIHAFVTSRLDNCNSLLSWCPNNSLRSLQVIQNAAARVLTGIDKRDHITPVLVSLHWLPIKFRIIFKTLLLTYKVLRGLAPSYLKGASDTLTPQ
ncbi:hypothetical protein D4764_04G0013120 [Takifugu flavidus]|uniref:Alkylated DNA repair protein AlkB homologue 8 N-terminal domain-containing protein n=1 Tax=Takifugu flavidus TaxID=433684 RepID=A0A5C6N6F3_9TELE|nr:hypothetical protein D4764_04G0013120 [Takifugu flavidus]